MVTADGGGPNATESRRTVRRIAQFNDPGTLAAALEPGDVALVLTEPAMTNNLHLLRPEPGWHQALRELTRRHGTLLALDETHTHVVGPGGATGQWHLHPDMVTIGKAVAGGLPMGAYGVTRNTHHRHRRSCRPRSGTRAGADGDTGYHEVGLPACQDPCHFFVIPCGRKIPAAAGANLS